MYGVYFFYFLKLFPWNTFLMAGGSSHKTLEALSTIRQTEKSLTTSKNRQSVCLIMVLSFMPQFPLWKKSLNGILKLVSNQRPKDKK